MGRDKEGEMPKEITYGDPTPGVEEGDRPVVAVRWGREDNSVQIVTRLYDAEVPSPEDRDPIPAKYGFYVHLQREGINKLIRDLRRARDQAFGRDE